MGSKESREQHEASDPQPGASQEAAAEQQTGSADERLTVVGIGASAGGLTALQGFFDALGTGSGLAFVVVTHMDPERESLLPELLQKHTTMPVTQVQDLTAIEPDHVYVIPPGRSIHVTDTHLDTVPFDEPRGQRMPVDYFFRSLADVHREAVAVVLSGGGTDGAVGVKAIKEHGGLLLVQDPSEAEYDSMPRAAIGTGLADLVLPVAELAEKLIEYHRNGVHLPKEAEGLSDDELETVYRILTQVQLHTGHDFSQYKQSTLLRRIRRRMQLNGNQTLDGYLSELRHNATEARTLFNDLLIGVTNFFRDRDSWEALGDQVISRLFESKSQEDTVRVWSIGCATGEEAYSLAILLLEHAATLERPPAARPDLQVFASDLDDDALHKAREGVYPEVIEADVSPERLARWFVKEGHYYRVRQELRDIVLFSNHSVLRDPPFSRLDLISCRNLLIYLNRDLQESVFRIFHYALNATSYLFLGSAESAEMVHDLFATLDKHHRLYQARPVHDKQLKLPTLPLKVSRLALQHPPDTRVRRRPAGLYAFEESEKLHRQSLEAVAPPSVLVDSDYHILHISNSAGRYLLHQGGVPSADVLNLVRPELKLELSSALFHVFEQQQAVLSVPVFVRFNGAARRVILAVRPHHGLAGEQLALVFFLEDEFHQEAAPLDEQTPSPEGDPTSETGALQEWAVKRHDDGQEGNDAVAGREAVVARLQTEIRRLRERLQTTTEQYESSHEELKAANEELQSINEEYRSTTEELETSKEELQSVNEELQTVNAELKNKLQEVSRAHGDLENLMVATDIATLFLDRELRIQRYTASTAELFNIMPGDRGRPIDHLTNRLQYEGLAQDAARVLRRLTPFEREVQDQSGRWFLAQLRPYRTLDDRIDGVVLTFVDVTELKETEAALRASEERLRKILQIGAVGVLFFDENGTIIDANDAFLKQVGFTRSEMEAGELSWQKLTPPEWIESSLQQLAQLEETGLIGPYEKEYYRKDGSRLWFLFAGARLDDGSIVEFCIDISQQKEVESALRAEKEFSQKIVATVREGLLVLRPDLTVEFANESFYHMFGVEEQETIGSVIYQLGNGQWDIRELRTLLEEILPRQNVFNDFRVEHEFESIGRRVMLLNARRLDHVERVLLAIEDITHREQYEQELRESEARYRTLFESIDAGFCVIEVLFSGDEAVDYRFLEANPAFARQTGLQDAVGKRMRALVPEHEAHWFEIYGEIARSGEPQRFTQEARYLDNRWYEVYAYPIGRPEEHRVAILFSDISKRKLAEEALLELNEQLEERVEERTEQVRELASQLTMAEHEERARVSQILHDDLQQQLYGMQIQLTFLRSQTDSMQEAESMQQEIDALEQSVQTAINTARQLSVELSPPILQGEGLAEALGWLANSMERRYRLHVDIEAEDSVVIPDLDRRVLLFQTVRELLFNVVKHANVPEATVKLWKTEDDKLGPLCHIQVSDDGVGFDPQTILGSKAQPTGRGLLYIRERLRFIGGRLEIQSVPGDGVIVTVVAPLEAEAKP